VNPGGTALDEFAEAHGLEAAESVELATSGALLSENDLKQRAAATGALPGGETGTVCHLTYTTRSNDSTRTHDKTAVVIRVPESIGFAPYLAAGETSLYLGTKTRSVKLDGGGQVRAADGIDEAWLTELLSPAFTHWLQRSPDGFGWELAEGVLCVWRDGHLTTERELVPLCEDAALIARTVREESLEEVDSGKAEASAAETKTDSEGKLAKAILDRTTFAHPPADVAEAMPQFRGLVVRHPSTYFVALFMTLAWMLGINIIGGGIFGLLLNLPNPGLAVLIFELALFAVVGFLCLRSQINGISKRLATEGFWREYARGRDLRSEDPGAFAATHAKAGLPGRPKRVLTGVFGGIPGSLMLTGDGLKRGDSIALVSGPSGPIATAELDLSAPGASARALDAYVETLVLDLQTQPGT
jgi:hypothetical protein